MKNTKIKSPNTKKPPNAKPDLAVTYFTGNGSGAWVLKDEPTVVLEQRRPFDFEKRTDEKHQKPKPKHQKTFKLQTGADYDLCHWRWRWRLGSQGGGAGRSGTAASVRL